MALQKSNFSPDVSIKLNKVSPLAVLEVNELSYNINYTEMSMRPSYTAS